MPVACGREHALRRPKLIGGLAVNDYVGGIFHQDRMRTLRGEADGSRLAALGRHQSRRPIVTRRTLVLAVLILIAFSVLVQQVVAAG